MLLDEAVALAGGAIDAEEIAERLSGNAALALGKAMETALWVAQAAASSRSLGGVHLAVTQSTSMDCRTRRLDDETSVILIPVGILARTRALTRRFLFHLGQDRPDIVVAGSALDERTFPWELAPGLQPIFGEDVADYWAALDEFNLRTAGDADGDAVADDAMAMSLHYLALHELGHLFGRHDRLVKLARVADPRIPEHLDLPALRRGMEVSADVFAAQNFTPSLLRNPVTTHSANTDSGVFFFMSSFVVAMLFGMYDVHRKTVYDYDQGFYPHPIIRYEFWDEATTTGLEQAWTGSTEAAARQRNDGWLACMQCFNNLEWDCFTGEYGSPPPEAEGGTGRYVPVTALKYGAASALQPRMREDNRLWLEVEHITEALLDS